jgi:regulator of protease activity HflC (stomatin/prohibitin superfamily)
MIEIFGDKSLFEVTQNTTGKAKIAEQQWVEVSLRDLSRQFSYNSVVAEDRWMGKRILTKAMVDSVDDGFNDNSVTVSMNDGFGIDLECNHSRRDRSFRTVGRGRSVWIIGTLYGESTGLKMQNCSYHYVKPLTESQKLERQAKLDAQRKKLEAQRRARQEKQRQEQIQKTAAEMKIRAELSLLNNQEEAEINRFKKQVSDAHIQSLAILNNNGYDNNSYGNPDALSKITPYLNSLPGMDNITVGICTNNAHTSSKRVSGDTFMTLFYRCANLVDDVRNGYEIDNPKFKISDQLLMQNRHKFASCARTSADRDYIVSCLKQ